MHSRVLIIALLLGANVIGMPAGSALAQVHNAHWYHQDAASGNHSVILNVVDGNDAIVAVAREKGVSITLLEIGTDLSFERKVLNCSPPLSCFPPSILLGIDKNMNGRYDADDFAWQWSLASGSPDPALLHGDTFIQCENVANLTGPDAMFVYVNARAEYACYSPNIAGMAYDLFVPYFPSNLSVYQTTGAPGSGITPVSTVVALKVLAGGSGSWMNFTALVDVVTMGGSNRIDDPKNSRSHFEVVTSR